MAKYQIGDIFQGSYPVTQVYGNNPDYYKQFGFAGHEGVDWGTPVGVNILAPFKRNIILQDQDDPRSGAYGNYIVVWDPEQKCAIWYCHESLNNVALGQEFPQGTVLAQTGNTGNTTGPHLHVNFVETDANGVRLNQNNGFKGMLNILDPNLVEWTLGQKPAPEPTTPVVGNTYKGYDLTNQDSMKVAVDVLVRVQNGEFIDKPEYDRVQQLVTNLNQQINDRNNDIAKLNSQLSTLKTQLANATLRIDSLTSLAKQIPDLTAQLEQALQDRKVCLAAQASQNQKITKLEKTSYTTATKKNLFGELVKQLFHINN